MLNSATDEKDKQEITRRVRRLAVQHIQAGVSTGTLIICKACRFAKPLIGATCYGKYRLCNDCTLSYELAKAEGRAPDIESFMRQQRPELMHKRSTG